MSTPLDKRKSIKFYLCQTFYKRHSYKLLHTHIKINMNKEIKEEQHFSWIIYNIYCFSNKTKNNQNEMFYRDSSDGRVWFSGHLPS